MLKLGFLFFLSFLSSPIFVPLFALPHLGKVGDPDRGRVAVNLGPLVRLGVLEAVDDCFIEVEWREERRAAACECRICDRLGRK